MRINLFKFLKSISYALKSAVETRCLASQCQRRYARDEMRETICERRNARDDMPETRASRLYRQYNNHIKFILFCEGIGSITKFKAFSVPI